MIRNYVLESPETWQGRIDDTEDYDSFRWHQWIKLIDLNDNSLKAFDGTFAFCLIGFECDFGIGLNKGRVGAAKGPVSIRKELANLPCQFNEEIKIFDAGNIITDGLSLDEAQDCLGEAVNRILDLNMFPIVLGGGHETAFGHFKGLFKHFLKDDESIGIINFDAHFDTRPYEKFGGTSGTMFRQIRDLVQENGFDYNYMCIGIQKHSNTKSLFNFAKENEVKYILAKDIVNRDIPSLFDEIDEFIQSVDYIYITICSDVFSTAFAPGVSAPQALGMDPEKAIVLLKHILSHENVVSFDIAEVSPRFDKDNTTATLAAVLIFSLVTKISTLIEKRKNKKKIKRSRSY
ncbi:formimidoylglutamase [Peptoniphilus catoniae]|uniref:formimidoylglutamase n=1 Tax=Peptoniphilus catoniae TaxID=1660341 RepID=UPI0010FE067A|nr:formimidoylglutamase [Peptoniphilus catoniae]